MLRVCSVAGAAIVFQAVVVVSGSLGGEEIRVRIVLAGNNYERWDVNFEYKLARKSAQKLLGPPLSVAKGGDFIDSALPCCRRLFSQQSAASALTFLFQN